MATSDGPARRGETVLLDGPDGPDGPDDQVKVSADYLKFLEGFGVVEDARHCSVVTCITVHDLYKLLVRPEAATLECTEFSKIFYDDVHIMCEPSKLNEIQQKLIDWYSKGSARRTIYNDFTCIYIGKYELDSAAFQECHGCYCCGLSSEYYINVNSDKRTIYNIYTNLKQSGRLSDSDNIVQFLLDG
jgi:hypothetical protein